MDDSLVAPGSMPDQSVPDPVPPTQFAPPPESQPVPGPKAHGSFQSSKAFIVIPIVLIIIIIAAGAYLIANKHAVSTSSSITILPTTTLAPANTSAGQNTTTSRSTVASTTILNAASSTNKTITLAQVTSVLGSGWTVTFQRAALNGTNMSLGNGSTANVDIGSINFAYNGVTLITSWTQFQNPQTAIGVFNQAMSSAGNGTVTGTLLGGATYFYGSSSAPGGISVIDAYEGDYVISIYANAGILTKAQGEALLSDQLSNLGVTQH